jgi:ribosome biogenesis protein BRX1
MTSEYDTDSDTPDDPAAGDAASLIPRRFIPPPPFAHRTLILSKRGISSFLRFFMKDFSRLIASSVRASKFSGSLIGLNELAETHNCDHVALFESLAGDSHLLSVASTPGGPTAVFAIANIHTIEELHLLGRCSEESRRLLFFDPAFDGQIHFSIAKELLRRCFGGRPAAESPDCFVDTCVTFAVADARIWVARYQVCWEEGTRRLFEAGPRFCLDLLAILNGSFCGQSIYKKGKIQLAGKQGRRPRKVKQ